MPICLLTPVAEEAPAEEAPKPKKRGRKSKAEKEAEEAAARAAIEAALLKLQLRAEDFVVPEAAQFAVGADDADDEVAPNAIEQLREKNGCPNKALVPEPEPSEACAGNNEDQAARPHDRRG